MAEDNKPNAQERQAQYDVEKNIALQDEFDQFVEMAGDEYYQLDMEELPEIFAEVKKYANNIEKHKNSRVQNPRLLRAYVEQLDLILIEIKNAQQSIAYGKESLGNYKKLRRNQQLFEQMLYSSIAIIGGRYYSPKDIRNRKAIARVDSKIARASSRKKAEKVEALKAKKGNLEARQREIADVLVKDHYRKLNPRFWEIGTRRYKKQADYAALNDYIEEAAKKYEEKTIEIKTKRDNNKPYNPVKWLRSLRLLTREGLSAPTTGQDWFDNIHWLGVSPFGIRLRHLANKIGKFNDGKVKGADNEFIIKYFDMLDESVYIGKVK